ncbi:hypothetical protein AANUM_0858 [Aggregatibacter actinomycetemcomitans NUM4039]|nr:hypothetical protein [Aggregatibacter actinomycetemcomitans]BAS48089.1 hypothetical protein AANUM_0858 [Aggregatibacter actinomycetemcomitans NUM4039]
MRTATKEEQTSLLGWAWKMINPSHGQIRPRQSLVKKPIVRFTKSANEAGFNIATPRIGQIFQINTELRKEAWWESVK